jgi:hypothetical protein
MLLMYAGVVFTTIVTPNYGAVHTMDHEVVPRKRPILRGTTSGDDFHGADFFNIKKNAVFGKNQV